MHIKVWQCVVKSQDKWLWVQKCAWYLLQYQDKIASTKLIPSVHCVSRKISPYCNCHDAGASVCCLRQVCMCWLSSPTSPTHSHPPGVWGQRTWTARTLRLWNLSNIVARSGSLQMGHGFPSLFSLDTALWERWLPQQAVRWGSRRSSKVTGQKKSSEGRSTKSNSSGSEVVGSWGVDGGRDGTCAKWPGSSIAVWLSLWKTRSYNYNVLLPIQKTHMYVAHLYDPYTFM